MMPPSLVIAALSGSPFKNSSRPPWTQRRVELAMTTKPSASVSTSMSRQMREIRFISPPDIFRGISALHNELKLSDTLNVVFRIHAPLVHHGAEQAHKVIVALISLHY